MQGYIYSSKFVSPLFYIWVKGKKYKKLKIKLPFDFQIFTYIPRAPKPPTPPRSSGERYFLKIHTTAKYLKIVILKFDPGR